MRTPIPTMLNFRQNKVPSSMSQRKDLRPGQYTKRDIFRVDRYKKKYKQTKRLVKELIFENAAVCDQIAILQEKTLLLIEERSFLFKKLQQYNPIENDIFRTPTANENSVTKKSTSKKKSEKNPSDSTETSKPSKSKKPSAPRKKKIVKSIPLDSNGKPIFPIVLGDFTVHSIGEVCDKPEYYTEDLIYPIGYCSSRIYGSLKDPEKQCVYTCKVMDGGAVPRFEIVADMDLDVPIVGSSIDQCHAMLLSHINASLGTEVVNSKGRGGDFFGISHPTIHHLIQSSPGVRKCKGYVWTKFEVNPNYEYVADEMEASLSYNALMRSILFSKSHLESMIKHESSGSDFSEDVNALRNMLLA